MAELLTYCLICENDKIRVPLLFGKFGIAASCLIKQSDIFGYKQLTKYEKGNIHLSYFDCGIMRRQSKSENYGKRPY